jgi:hypothetical protein
MRTHKLMVVVFDHLAELGRLMSEQNADGETLAGQPSAGSENSTNMEPQFDSTMLEGER